VPLSVDIHVGKRMRQRREMRGLPQKGLARQLGISFQQVQKYESGANRISASKLWQLCGALDVEPGYFFEGLEGANRARPRAAGEAPQAAYEVDPLSARQILDLNQNFQRIVNARVRRQVVQLVKSLTGS